MTKHEFDTAYNEGYKNGYEAGQNERSHGEWIENKDDPFPYHKKWVCSICNQWQTYGRTDFCPKCGADMRGERV